MNFDATAWDRAERAAFEALIAAIPNSREGRNAFLGELPDMYNTWSFITGDGPTNGPWNQSMVSMRMQAVIVGRYVERKDAQRFAMSVVALLRGPVRGTEPVYLFRGGTTQPTCRRDAIDAANHRQPVPVWTAEIPAEIVFETKG